MIMVGTVGVPSGFRLAGRRKYQAGPFMANRQDVLHRRRFTDQRGPDTLCGVEIGDLLLDRLARDSNSSVSLSSKHA
jgi:hypothetical protein